MREVKIAKQAGDNIFRKLTDEFIARGYLEKEARVLAHDGIRNADSATKGLMLKEFAKLSQRK